MANIPDTNITLIGMPGSGKSYIGKKLADILSYSLVELDSIFEKEYNLPLLTILENLDEESFLKKQLESLIVNTQGKSRLVISPGGSIIYTDFAMQHLKKVSIIIYLKTPIEVIERRVKETPRKIIGLKNKTLEELYNERSLLYEKYATVTIDADQRVDKVIRDILTSCV